MPMGCKRMASISENYFDILKTHQSINNINKRKHLTNDEIIVFKIYYIFLKAHFAKRDFA